MQGILVNGSSDRKNGRDYSVGEVIVDGQGLHDKFFHWLIFVNDG